MDEIALIAVSSPITQIAQIPKEEKEPEIDRAILNSCVLGARYFGLSLPKGDAKDLKPNGNPEIGGGILLEYSTGSHVAVIESFKKDGFAIVETNYRRGTLTRRIVRYDDKFIKGFWNELSTSK